MKSLKVEITKMMKDAQEQGLTNDNIFSILLDTVADIKKELTKLPNWYYNLLDEYHLKSVAELIGFHDSKDYYRIVHVKPCSSFDLTKKDEQKKCFHYSNLEIMRNS